MQVEDERRRAAGLALASIEERLRQLRRGSFSACGRLQPHLPLPRLLLRPLPLRLLLLHQQPLRSLQRLLALRFQPDPVRSGLQLACSSRIPRRLSRARRKAIRHTTALPSLIYTLVRDPRVRHFLVTMLCQLAPRQQMIRCRMRLIVEIPSQDTRRIFPLLTELRTVLL